jgi:peptidyl-prolyl cis-trans isomerase A (cyclophilin A)
MGDIKVNLFPDHAPKTVRNFTELAEGTKEWTNPKLNAKSSAPLYDGTIFHRVISGFMIQGGDPLGTGTGGPGYRFEDEAHPELVFDKPYLLAMANAGPNTNGSQFFIVSGQSGVRLPPQYSLFGKVVKGLDILEAMQSVKTDRNDRPLEDVVIQSVTITES